MRRYLVTGCTGFIGHHIVAALLDRGVTVRGLTRRPFDSAPMPGVEYYCTDATGARREIGDVICITASCQVWVARCEVSLNNPTWRKLSDGCPGVSAKPMGVMDRLEALRAG